MSINSILSADPGVLAITTEIHNSQAPQGTDAPYVVINIINVNPENLMSEVPNIEQQLYQIVCVSTDPSKSVTLFKACRDALEPVGYVQNVPLQGELDPKTELYRTLFDYYFWDNR